VSRGSSRGLGNERNARAQQLSTAAATTAIELRTRGTNSTAPAEAHHGSINPLSICVCTGSWVCRCRCSACVNLQTGGHCWSLTCSPLNRTRSRASSLPVRSSHGGVASWQQGREPPDTLSRRRPHPLCDMAVFRGLPTRTCRAVPHHRDDGLR
jgi:hypothetical protein